MAAQAAVFPPATRPARSSPVAELVSPSKWHLYRDEKLVDCGDNPLGVVPLVHVQNVARPFDYEGGGDVEPLLPLQDELNTRLSDRATRVALQSMKMYLGVGIEGFGGEPILPGRMWSSDNPDARVVEFGGDGHSPSEEATPSARSARPSTSRAASTASPPARSRARSATSPAPPPCG